MKEFKIYLSASSELIDERNVLGQFIEVENEYLKDFGISFKLTYWDNQLEAISKTRLQDEYNKEIQISDIHLFLFFSKVGKYTEEEFDISFGNFKKEGSPKYIFTYFKDSYLRSLSIRESDISSLIRFREKLGALGHFPSTYDSILNLVLFFKTQLYKILKKEGCDIVPSNLTYPFADKKNTNLEYDNALLEHKIHFLEIFPEVEANYRKRNINTLIGYVVFIFSSIFLFILAKQFLDSQSQPQTYVYLIAVLVFLVPFVRSFFRHDKVLQAFKFFVFKKSRKELIKQLEKESYAEYCIDHPKPTKEEAIVDRH